MTTMKIPSSFRRIIYVLGFTMLLGAVVAGIAAAAGSSASRASSQVGSLEAAQVQAPSSAIVAVLPILGRPRSAADALPAKFSEGFVEQQNGANPSLARRASTSSSGDAVLLLPSQEGVCMLNTPGTESFCATATEVTMGDASEAILCAPVALPTSVVEIGGVLPEEATDARAVLSDGAGVPLTVTAGTYVADFPRTGPLPSSIEWSAAGRRHEAPTHIPAGVATEDCVSPPVG
jgi:hypothetical protein